MNTTEHNVPTVTYISEHTEGTRVSADLTVKHKLVKSSPVSSQLNFDTLKSSSVTVKSSPDSSPYSSESGPESSGTDRNG